VSDSRARLRARLEAPGQDLSVLDRLDDDEARRLLDLLDRASEQQRRGLEASMEAVLSHAPKMLRGRITRALFPGGAR
jgi:hypothetical protein